MKEVVQPADARRGAGGQVHTLEEALELSERNPRNEQRYEDSEDGSPRGAKRRRFRFACVHVERTLRRSQVDVNGRHGGKRENGASRNRRASNGGFLAPALAETPFLAQGETWSLDRGSDLERTHLRLCESDCGSATKTLPTTCSLF